MDILRFITAGNVDDGKSTLIGRLLYDSKNILTDQLEAIQKQSKNTPNNEIDLALLTDGLRAEREQGITIDVAYKYFTTDKRKFIIADAPGHIQYTRNMITGASNANLIIVLVDARNGVQEQTRRHSIIASLLKIPHVVVAINKMDMVEYSEETFNHIVQDYAKMAAELGLKEVSYIPISALKGDNIVDKSNHMDWYKGNSLITYLETVSLEHDVNLEITRFPVQYVIRPNSDQYHDYRGYAGKITSGVYNVGDEVIVLPVGLKSKIKAIEINSKSVTQAFAPQSIVLHLEDDIDISRGDLIVNVNHQPALRQEFDTLVCWMGQQPLTEGGRYFVQQNSRVVRAIIQEIEYKIDVNTLEKIPFPKQAQLNDIVKVKLKTAQPLPVDSYADLQTNGSAIIIDETSNITVGACLFQ